MNKKITIKSHTILNRSDIPNADICINDIIEDIEIYNKFYQVSSNLIFTFRIFGHLYDSRNYIYTYKFQSTFIEFSNIIIKIIRNYEYIDKNCDFELLKVVNCNFIQQSELTTILKNDSHIYTMTAKMFHSLFDIPYKISDDITIDKYFRHHVVFTKTFLEKNIQSIKDSKYVEKFFKMVYLNDYIYKLREYKLKIIEKL